MSSLRETLRDMSRGFKISSIASVPYRARSTTWEPLESGTYFVVLENLDKAVAFYDADEKIWKDPSGIRKYWCDNIAFYLHNEEENEG